MGKFKFNRLNSLLLVANVFVISAYFLFNRPIGHVHIVRSSLDSHIPFWPVFIVPYLIFLPIFWLVIIYAYLKNKNFAALAAAILSVYLISYLIFTVFQTFVPRPMVVSHDVFSGVVRWTYRLDRPYGAWPSLHAASATLMALYFIFTRSKWWLEYLTFAVLVVLSTLFVKQHFLADALSGIALGTAVGLLIFKPWKKGHP
jgi:membrane-associated phospholipid phosphatase